MHTSRGNSDDAILDILSSIVCSYTTSFSLSVQMKSEDDFLKFYLFFSQQGYRNVKRDHLNIKSLFILEHVSKTQRYIPLKMKGIPSIGAMALYSKEVTVCLNSTTGLSFIVFWLHAQNSLRLCCICFVHWV